MHVFFVFSNTFPSRYVPGGSIHSLLTKFGSFDEKLIRVYTRQVLQGLAYLHEHNLVHRDIKGANLLVDAQGTVKLADFGMATKILAGIDDRSAALMEMAGTPYWMAPEVVRRHPYGRPADVWSVGATVVEMATARPPWYQFSQEIAAIFHIAKCKEPPKLPPWASPDAVDFVAQCCASDPQARPDVATLLRHPFVAETDSTRRVPLSARDSSLASSPLLPQRLIMSPLPTASPIPSPVEQVAADNAISPGKAPRAVSLLKRRSMSREDLDVDTTTSPVAAPVVALSDRRRNNKPLQIAVPNGASQHDEQPTLAAAEVQAAPVADTEAADGGAANSKPPSASDHAAAVAQAQLQSSENDIPTVIVSSASGADIRRASYDAAMKGGMRLSPVMEEGIPPSSTASSALASYAAADDNEGRQGESRHLGDELVPPNAHKSAPSVLQSQSPSIVSPTPIKPQNVSPQRSPSVSTSPQKTRSEPEISLAEALLGMEAAAPPPRQSSRQVVAESPSSSASTPEKKKRSISSRLSAFFGRSSSNSPPTSVSSLPALSVTTTKNSLSAPSAAPQPPPLSPLSPSPTTTANHFGSIRSKRSSAVAAASGVELTRRASVLLGPDPSDRDAVLVLFTPHEARTEEELLRRDDPGALFRRRSSKALLTLARSASRGVSPSADDEERPVKRPVSRVVVLEELADGSVVVERRQRVAVKSIATQTE